MQSRSQGGAVRWLLILPFAGLLVPALYAHAQPAFFGMPFFYWYQFAWLAGTSALLGIVYRATR